MRYLMFVFAVLLFVGCGGNHTIGTVTHIEKAIVSGREVQLVTIKSDDEKTQTFCDTEEKINDVNGRYIIYWGDGDHSCIWGGFYIVQNSKRSDAPVVKGPDEYKKRLENQSAPPINLKDHAPVVIKCSTEPAPATAAQPEKPKKEVKPEMKPAEKPSSEPKPAESTLRLGSNGSLSTKALIRQRIRLPIRTTTLLTVITRSKGLSY